MKARLSIKGIWEVLKNSFSGFSNDKVTKLSGSLAYSTVFSMGPLLILIISLCSIVWGRDAVEGKIYGQLASFMGSDTAIQLQSIIQKAALSGKKTLAAIIGGVTLLFGATAIFSEIQDSVNMIWGLKPKPKKGWLKMLQNRFLSFSIIVSLGFLLLVSLAVTTVIDGFNTRLQSYFPDVTIVLFYILNQVITLVITTIIFAVIFRVLPDAKISWRDVLGGSLVTAILFMAGKFGISFYISKSSVGTTFGAAGALVILMLWTYYSSIILYFGAEFTKAYAVKYGAPIQPNAYAVTTKSVEVETNGATIQQNEAQAKKL